MKVLLINKFFYLKGGSETSFFDTAHLLQDRGHQLSFLAMEHPQNFDSSYSKYFVSKVDFDNPASFLEKMKIPGRILYSLEAKRKLSALLQKEKPDIAHGHNIHHQISPSILHALRTQNIPTVLTLHDYKIVCPVYTLLRKGQICEKCRGGRYLYCLFYKCCKNSYFKSFLNTVEMYLHHHFLRIYGFVDIFVSPSQFLKRKVEELGFHRKIAHLPNFISARDILPSSKWSENALVYFGRLSQEKGLFTLLSAVKGLDIKCKIYGDGPLQEDLRQKAKKEGLANVHFLGHRPQEELKAEIRKAMFVVLPSEWYENHPRSILESFALGKPVLGSRIGGIPELIQEQETGLLFEPGNPDDLRKKILSLKNNSEKIIQMGEKARRFVEQNLNPEKHYETLMRIYEQAIRKHK